MSKTNTTPSPLISVADAATYLSVSTRTVRRLIERGEIPIVRTGGSVRIARPALHSYVAMHTELERGTHDHKSHSKSLM
jgi:excisionase family DNA binding protein